MNKSVREVVVVDQVPLEREILVQLLSRRGCAVVAAGSLSEALGILGSDIAAVAVCFVEAAQLTGSNALAAFRRNGGCRLVALVGTGRPPSPAELARQGVTEILVKPYALDSLTAIVG